ncbi:MAG: hypothetical protein QOD53_1739, partial [Thermoleophilaceae bacterium]|nr:hypothetical protein [Thermoleophilaceae bacterium]
ETRWIAAGFRSQRGFLDLQLPFTDSLTDESIGPIEALAAQL